MFLILLGGCSSASEAENDSIEIPGVGSQFTSQVTHRVGSDGKLRQEVMKFSVQVAEMILEGKEQVVQFATDTLISLISYESNGDLSLYMSQGKFGTCQREPLWLLLRFGGGPSLTDTLVISDECVVVWNGRPSGQERVVIDGESFETTRILAELKVYVAPGDVEDAGMHAREYKLWYAPELGYVVQEHITSLQRVGDQVDTIGISERELM